MSIPIGLNLTSIGVTADWWLEGAARAEAGGFDAVWIWDHFISRGRPDDPVLECWSMLAAASRTTTSIRLGSFVTNVMNRHPAVLARIVATTAELSAGRIELGIGAGGHPAEHEAYGIAFPKRSVRGEHLEEAITVLRLLLAGGPADFEGRYYRLEAAHAFPVPSPPPRIVLGGETPVGAAIAAHRADAWTYPASRHDELMPVFEAELREAGRDRADVAALVTIEVEDVDDDLGALSRQWQGRGADEIVVHDVQPSELDALIALT